MDDIVKPVEGDKEYRGKVEEPNIRMELEAQIKHNQEKILKDLQTASFMLVIVAFFLFASIMVDLLGCGC